MSKKVLTFVLAIALLTVLTCCFVACNDKADGKPTDYSMDRIAKNMEDAGYNVQKVTPDDDQLGFISNTFRDIAVDWIVMASYPAEHGPDYWIDAVYKFSTEDDALLAWGFLEETMQDFKSTSEYADRDRLIIEREGQYVFTGTKETIALAKK